MADTGTQFNISPAQLNDIMVTLTDITRNWEAQKKVEQYMPLSTKGSLVVALDVPYGTSYAHSRKVFNPYYLPQVQAAADEWTEKTGVWDSKFKDADQLSIDSIYQPKDVENVVYQHTHDVEQYFLQISNAIGQTEQQLTDLAQQLTTAGTATTAAQLKQLLPTLADSKSSDAATVALKKLTEDKSNGLGFLYNQSNVKPYIAKLLDTTSLAGSPSSSLAFQSTLKVLSHQLSKTINQTLSAETLHSRDNLLTFNFSETPYESYQDSFWGNDWDSKTEFNVARNEAKMFTPEMLLTFFTNKGNTFSRSHSNLAEGSNVTITVKPESVSLVQSQLQEQLNNPALRLLNTFSGNTDSTKTMHQVNLANIDMAAAAFQAGQYNPELAKLGFSKEQFDELKQSVTNPVLVLNLVKQQYLSSELAGQKENFNPVSLYTQARFPFGQQCYQDLSKMAATDYKPSLKDFSIVASLLQNFSGKDPNLSTAEWNKKLAEAFSSGQLDKANPVVKSLLAFGISENVLNSFLHSTTIEGLNTDNKPFNLLHTFFKQYSTPDAVKQLYGTENPGCKTTFDALNIFTQNNSTPVFLAHAAGQQAGAVQVESQRQALLAPQLGNEVTEQQQFANALAALNINSAATAGEIGVKISALDTSKPETIDAFAKTYKITAEQATLLATYKPKDWAGNTFSVELLQFLSAPADNAMLSGLSDGDKKPSFSYPHYFDYLSKTLGVEAGKPIDAAVVNTLLNWSTRNSDYSTQNPYFVFLKSSSTRAEMIKTWAAASAPASVVAKEETTASSTTAATPNPTAASPKFGTTFSPKFCLYSADYFSGQQKTFNLYNIPGGMTTTSGGNYNLYGFGNFSTATTSPYSNVTPNRPSLAYYNNNPFSSASTKTYSLYS